MTHEQDPYARRNQEPILNTGMRIWLSELESEASQSHETDVRFASVYTTAVVGALFIAWREGDRAASLAMPLSYFLSELGDPETALTGNEAQENETLIALASKRIPELWHDSNPNSQLAQSLAKNGEDGTLADHAAFLIEMFEEVRPDLQEKINRLETTEQTNAAITAAETIMGRFFPDTTEKPTTPTRTTFSKIEKELSDFAALVRDRSATYESMESLVREDLQKAIDNGQLTLDEALSLLQDFIAKAGSN